MTRFERVNHILEFWGGCNDGSTLRVNYDPEEKCTFRVDGMRSVMLRRGEDTPEADGVYYVGYDFFGINEAGNYLYIEHEMMERGRDKDLFYS